jgi:hypothetical protein
MAPWRNIPAIFLLVAATTLQTCLVQAACPATLASDGVFYVTDTDGTILIVKVTFSLLTVQQTLPLRRLLEDHLEVVTASTMMVSLPFLPLGILLSVTMMTMTISTPVIIREARKVRT